MEKKEKIFLRISRVVLLTHDNGLVLLAAVPSVDVHKSGFIEIKHPSYSSNMQSNLYRTIALVAVSVYSAAGSIY